MRWVRAKRHVPAPLEGCSNASVLLTTSHPSGAVTENSNVPLMLG